MKSPSEDQRSRANAPASRGWDLRSRRAAPRGPPALSSPGPAAGATCAFPRIAEAKVGSGRQVSRKATEEQPPVSRSPTPRGGKRTSGGQGPAGAHAQCATSRLGLESPRGLLRSRLGPLRCRRPFSETPVSAAAGDPRIPEPESLGPRVGTRGPPLLPGRRPGRDHSPAGAAVAAAVPEVPEGAPKLKAISKEQEAGPHTLLPRYWVPSDF